MAELFDESIFKPPSTASANTESGAPLYDNTVFTAPKDVPDLGIKPSRSNGVLVDSANALGTGFNRGLVNLAASIPDAAVNMLDLGKAAIGAPYIAATGKAPPSWLDLTDRTKIPGTSDWLMDRARQTDIGRKLLDASNPDYEGGYLQNSGSALSGLIPLGAKGLPASGTALTGHALSNLFSGNVGKAVGDATGNPAYAIAAGLSPSLVAKPAVQELFARSVRGDEAGRQAMVQRVSDLNAAGVANPSLGLATGTPWVGGAENLLTNTLGAQSVMMQNRDAANAGMQAKARATALLAANGRPTANFQVGENIQKDFGDWRDQFKANLGGRAYRAVDAAIPPDTPADLKLTLQKLGDLNAPIPGLPLTSQVFQNPTLKRIEGSLTSDLTKTTPGTPPGQMVTPPPLLAGSGLMNAPNAPITTPVPAGSPTSVTADTAPFQGVKKLRTFIGDKLAENQLTTDIPASKLAPAYAALSDDMRATAQRLDQQRSAGVAAGLLQPQPSAERALDVANRYYRTGRTRLDVLDPFTSDTGNRVAGETALERYKSFADPNSGDLTLLAAAKASLKPGTVGQIAGNVIDNLGTAKAGKQDETGSKWSSESFLTNWNKLSDEGKNQLFSGFPNSDQVRAEVDRLAKGTSMARDAGSLLANPSGTAGASAARAAFGGVFGGLGGVGTGLLTGGPVGAVVGGLLGTASPMVGSYAASKLLTNPGIVKAVAGRTEVDPKTLTRSLRALQGTGLMNQPRRIEVSGTSADAP